jgi:transmembrane sensor
MSVDHAAMSAGVEAAAAEWFTRMQDRTASHQEREQFCRWLQQSADHVQAYLAVVSLWQQLGDTEDARRAAAELIASARAETGATNIIALHGTLQAGGAAHGQGGHRRRPWLAAAAVLLAAAGIAGWIVTGQFARGEQYATAVGEQRSFTLADGSILRLNTRSKVRVHLDDDRREVELLAGEAMFEVARDAHRPFRVRADQTVVEAVGTAFNVYCAADGTRVTVLEGRVRVRTARSMDAATAPVELTPHEQARVSHSGQVTTERQISLEKTMSWTDRRLIFEHETLASVVEEFNRYNAQQLMIPDTGLAALRINGNFRATDPQSLVDFLQRTEAVVAAPDGQGMLMLSRRTR